MSLGERSVLEPVVGYSQMQSVLTENLDNQISVPLLSEPRDAFAAKLPFAATVARCAFVGLGEDIAADTRLIQETKQAFDAAPALTWGLAQNRPFPPSHDHTRGYQMNRYYLSIEFPYVPTELTATQPAEAREPLAAIDGQLLAVLSDLVTEREWYQQRRNKELLQAILDWFANSPATRLPTPYGRWLAARLAVKGRGESLVVDEEPPYFWPAELLTAKQRLEQLERCTQLSLAVPAYRQFFALFGLNEYAAGAPLPRFTELSSSQQYAVFSDRYHEWVMVRAGSEHTYGFFHHLASLLTEPVQRVIIVNDFGNYRTFDNYDDSHYRLNPWAIASDHAQTKRPNQYGPPTLNVWCGPNCHPPYKK